ncbi:MAG: purine-nucleoside phosphorylase [Candidatus Hydrogenedentes bacterium]|nr:purine-nucleoside phosphorylase [Candidatus Hydrogenedentota bacterium]
MDALKPPPGQDYPLAVVSGSGLNLRKLLDEIHGEVSFTEVNIPCGAVPGHRYCFLFGRCGETNLILQEGRLHLYEGLTLAEACAPVAALRHWGVHTIIFTNACGGLLPMLRPGDLVAVETFQAWPCTRAGMAQESSAASTDFLVPGCDAAGVYCWVHGPSYETRAEIHALQILGAHAVGMSTLPELLHAQRLGVATGVISCVTNSCLEKMPLTHKHVVEIARSASNKLERIMRRFVSSDPA